MRVVLEPYEGPRRFTRVGASLLALGATLLASVPLLAALGLDPATTLRIFFIEPLSSWNGVAEWMLKASPLILIALGLAAGFRANVWNIGAEGMFTVGAICAAWLGLRYGDAPHVWLLPAMMLTGAAGGMAWAAIPAFLMTRANTSEILVSLLLNYVAALALSFLVNGPLQDPNGLNYPQSASFGDAALFTPLFPGIRLNVSIGITIAAVGAAYMFLDRSFVGFQATVSGAAPAAGRYAGYRRDRLVWLCLLVGGGAAGLAGMMEVAGPLGQLSPVISPGYGYSAIIVAFIGRLNPFGIVLGGLLLSLLYLGGEAAQMTLNVPASLARTLQGLLLFFLLGADVLSQHRLRIR